MRLFALLLSLIRPQVATAQWWQLTSEVDVDPCATGALNCNNSGDLAGYLDSVFLSGNAVYMAFFGIFFTMLVVYGIRLVAMSHSDSIVGESVNAYTQALIGAIFVSGAAVLAQVFTVNNAVIVDTNTLEVSFLAQIVTFIIRIVGFVLLGNIVVQGIRLIIATDENQISSARTNLILSAIGTIIVLISRPIFRLVLPGAFQVGINEQIVGVANFLATLFGFFSVIAFVVAGIMLVVSVEESLKEKAQKLMIASIVSMAVVLLAYGLIRVLL